MQAYHAGFSHGANTAEAVNFMLADWLPYARLSMAAYRALRFAHRKPNPNASLDPEPDPDSDPDPGPGPGSDPDPDPDPGPGPDPQPDP